ncbi:S4 domain-containing protein YaaA [Acetivibrio clariflavus]|uniref:S4 domain protein YaaA n=1 Tax=Acetivibrio clariflavus (strain DSM 19732 / NBRC 101661 / EBR45) TaxID=720554 RepID=G8LYP5_ACECE|nr:S4 domain-containing protein YaaA [Acetivibrio clariflavus]AEV66763.1 S4 domain protein YaaA [Acetivibrio clariflavus DSM 19732]
MKNIKINTEYIKLDQFLKWTNIASSGAEAKTLIRNGLVKVNGEVENRRGKKLRKNDTIEINDNKFIIE